MANRSSTADLLKAIHKFIKATGMSPLYFGQRAAGNTRLVPRLENGGRVTLETAERIEKFIENYRA